MTNPFNAQQSTITIDYIKKEIDSLIKTIKERTSQDGIIVKNGYIKMENGLSYIKCVHYDPAGSVAIASVWSSAGSTSMIHHHTDSTETIYVITGKARVKLLPIDKKPYYTELNEDDSIIIKPNTPHLFHFPEETRLLVKTIPADKSFPRHE